MTYPDENYAREVMQLFTTGLVELHPDGTVRLDVEKRPIETNSVREIKELARVFTGLTFSRLKDGTTPVNLPAPEIGRFDLPMSVNNAERYKDMEAKSMF